MPEGPEIRRAADRLAKAIVGQPIESAWFAFPTLKHHEAALVGARVRAIDPHGKALLTRFDNGWTLYSHNQLYGVWSVAKAGERPDSKRTLRVAIETARSAILLYSASDIEMWRDDELGRHPFLAKLGPDVLDPSLDEAAVEQRLRGDRFSGRALSVLLLDQAFLAGMGNYLRSEVLFQARLLPSRRPRDLDDDERRRLAHALLDVPRRSYRTRGSRRYAASVNDTPAGFRFAVFDRAELPCDGCGGLVERREIGGRRLYLCPRCQR